MIISSNKKHSFELETLLTGQLPAPFLELFLMLRAGRVPALLRLDAFLMQCIYLYSLDFLRWVTSSFPNQAIFYSSYFFRLRCF